MSQIMPYFLHSTSILSFYTFCEIFVGVKFSLRWNFIRWKTSTVNVSRHRYILRIPPTLRAPILFDFYVTIDNLESASLALLLVYLVFSRSGRRLTFGALKKGDHVVLESLVSQIGKLRKLKFFHKFLNGYHIFTRTVIVINLDNLCTFACIYWKEYIPISILPFNVNLTLIDV